MTDSVVNTIRISSDGTTNGVVEVDNPPSSAVKSILSSQKPTRPSRSVRFGAVEYQEKSSTVYQPTKSKLLGRTPTGKFSERERCNDSTESEKITVALVEQDTQAHHLGPTFRVTASFEKQRRRPLGLTILSNTESSTGPFRARIGEIKKDSCATRCTLGDIKLDDWLVEVNGTDIRGKSHEEVVTLMRRLQGAVTLQVERSTRFMRKKNVSPYFMASGTAALPSDTKKSKRSKQKSFRKSKKGKSRDSVSLAAAETVTVHRHPNSNGLQIGVRGGVEDDSFPKILTAVHPRSPFAPLVEGGNLSNECELLEINGEIALGMPHNDLIQTLKDVGEDVQLKVIAPALLPRQLSRLFTSPADDDVTAVFMDDLRRAMYTRFMSVTTEPAPPVGAPPIPGLRHVTLEEFQRLAAEDKLYEWVQHTNGFYYGLPKDIKARPLSDKPFMLAARLIELYPNPNIPEPVASPVRVTSPSVEIPAMVSSDLDDDNAASHTENDDETEIKNTSPVPLVEVNEGIGRGTLADLLTEIEQHTRSIAAATNDASGIAVHCRAILSAVDAAKATPSAQVAQLRSAVDSEISAERDSGVSPDGAFSPESESNQADSDSVGSPHVLTSTAEPKAKELLGGPLQQRRLVLGKDVVSTVI